MIYVNGCSHSIGISKYSWSYVLGNSLFRSFSYMAHKGLDEDNSINFITNKNSVYNFSDSGKGNDTIFHETIEFLSKCKQNNIKPDYIFVQWSGPSRMARQDAMGNIIFINPGNLIEKEFINFEPHASRTTLSYIYSLQEILKKENIEYSFCCYMELDKGIKKYSVYDSIDLTKFITFDNVSHPMFDGFRNKMRINGFVLDAAGHPNYYGHWFIANKFLEKINIPNLNVGFFELILPLITDAKSSYPIFKSTHFEKILSFYEDDMLNRNSVKELTLTELLIDGEEDEKNDIRKTIF